MAKKILIIDDDPIMTKYLTTLFGDNGYETCSATDGLSGYETLKKEKPDLVTLDLQMPDGWGPKFYRQMSKDPDFKDTPVVVISGLDGDHAVRKAVAFVRKPFDPDKLIGVVRGAIGGAR